MSMRSTDGSMSMSMWRVPETSEKGLLASHLLQQMLYKSRQLMKKTHVKLLGYGCKMCVHCEQEQALRSHGAGCKGLDIF
jgi:hypothetical protein